MSKEKDKEIFSSVPEDERTALFRDLEKLKSEMMCKLKNNDDLVYVEASRYDGHDRLICSLKAGSPPPQKLPQPVVVAFSLNAERYFFTTDLKEHSGGFYLLDVSGTIFQLQRRENFRVRIPESYGTLVGIGTVNGEPFNLRGNVVDLSAGGCRITIKNQTPALKAGDKITGELLVGRKPEFPFDGIVRHVKMETKPLGQTLGFEFAAASRALENRIFSITMELHREFFSRRGER